MRIQVSGAIASKNGVTLFTPEGTSKVYGQDSWRTADLLKAVLLPLAAAGGEPIEVELDDYSLVDRIKQITGGAVEAKETIKDGVSSLALNVAGTAIADTSTLAKHIARAVYEGSPGLGKFLERFATVKHMDTAQEVLKFMEKLDLPLADDGCMVLYKFLDAAPGKQGYYVDHHTKKVMQRVGSRVYMDLKDYTQSRTECATGLHVCSKDYGQYGGRILIVKVRPEDIVAVPHHESGKMRVLAYHIVASLDDDVHKAVAARKSALTAKGAKGIIAEVIAGQHIGVIEEVLVGAQGQHTVKVLDKVEVTTPRNEVRVIEEKPAAIDPKKVKEAIKASKDLAKAGFALDQGVLMDEATTVFIRDIQGTKALVATRLKHGAGSWVSLSRLTAIPAEVAPETPSPALPSPSAGGQSLMHRVGEDDSKAREACEALAAQLHPSPAPQNQAVGDKQTKVVKAAPRIKQGRKTEAPVAGITPEYRKKLDEAQKMLNAGATLRQIDKALSMCRKSLARHIALGNLKAVEG